MISDKLGKRATTCAVMLLLAAPTVSVHVTFSPTRPGSVGLFSLSPPGSVLQLYGFSMISQFGLGPTIGEIIRPFSDRLFSAPFGRMSGQEGI